MLKKKKNSLLNKGMSNIYLKVSIEKTRASQNFDFKSLKSSPPGQCLGSSNSRRYNWILKIVVATWKSEVCEQNYEWFFYYFYFQRNYDVLKSNSPCFLLNKNIKFDKNKTKSRMENLTHSFRTMNHMLQLV